jgi:hypothetical protein
MLQAKRLLASIFTTMALAIGCVPAASAQPALVNVEIEDNVITAPVNAAIAICADVDVNVAVLLAAIADPDVNTFDCDARADQDIEVRA